MSTATLAHTADRASADPGDRGALTITDDAVERIAAHAVTEITGVGGSASRVLGVAVGAENLDRGAKVTATVTGDTAALTVRLSISYPQPVRATTEATRDHLVTRVAELTGLTVERVDITVTALHTETTTARRIR